VIDSTPLAGKAVTAVSDRLMRHAIESNTLAVETIEEFAGFERLAPDWTALLDASPSASLFLTWEWLSAWWKHLAGRSRLSIRVVRRRGELVAVAPLIQRPPDLGHFLPFRTFEFLGTAAVGSDHLDLIIRRGCEREALAALAESMSRDGRLLNLANCNRESRHLLELATYVGQNGWSISESPTQACPFIRLSGHSWQSYLATLGPAHRYNLKRRLRNLSRHFDVRFDQVNSEKERRDSLATLVELHNMRWRRENRSGAFHTAALRAFYDEMSRLALERGWLRLFTLRLDSRPVAALLGFRYRHVFYFYQSGFDPTYSKNSVGLVAMGLAIKSAIEEGAAEYDMLWGSEPYKFLWTPEARVLGRLVLYPPGAWGTLSRRLLGLNRMARRMTKRVLIGRGDDQHRDSVARVGEKWSLRVTPPA